MSNYIVFIIMFFNCVLSIPFICINIKKRKESVFLIALFFAILGYWLRPYVENDLSRIYYFYESRKKLNISFSEIFIEKDFYLPLLMEIIKRINFPKYTLAFISAFITYYFTLKAFFKEMKEKKIRKYYFLFFIIFITSIPITGYTGIRFYPALSLFVYGIYLYSKNEKKYMIFMCFSFFVHFSLIIPVFIFVIYRFVGKKLSFSFLKKLTIISFILGFVLNEEFLLRIVEILNVLVGKSMFEIQYISGEWGNQFFTSVGLVQKIVILISVYMRKFILLFYMLIADKNKKITKFLFMMASVAFLLQNYKTSFERFFYIEYALILIFILKEKIYKSEKKLCFFYLVVFLHNIYILILNIRLYYPNYIYSYSNLLKLNILNIFIENIF